MRFDRTKGMDAARAHLRYIQRDGVPREGAPGALYSADSDRADGKAFLERQDGDRHQFRFIVSPEDGEHYDDLKSLTRRLMIEVEKDLGTKLDWVAVDHFNTGHPHTHIIVRGKTDDGRDLLIARDYISHGLRERAAELVSLDLSPRTDIEIKSRLRREVEQERLTALDHRFMKKIDAGRVVAVASHDPFWQTLRAGRLQTLGRLGLAEEIQPGQWRLADGLDDTLRRMGGRGDIIRTLQRAMTERGVARTHSDYAIFDPAQGRAVTGRVIERGLSDELNDRHYLVVDGTDGRSYYVEIGQGEATDLIPTGAVVWIAPGPIEARDVDRTVADIAAAHGGAIRSTSICATIRAPPKPSPRLTSAASKPCVAS